MKNNVIVEELINLLNQLPQDMKVVDYYYNDIIGVTTQMKYNPDGEDYKVVRLELE